MSNNHHKKAVFFLGAGFSKAVNPNFPTLQELTEEINTRYRGEKDSITQHYYDEIPSKYKENIEHLLTFLSSNLPFKTEVQISADDALYKDLRNNIAYYFEKQEKIDNIILNLTLENQEKLFHYLCEKRVSCITLNYDLLLENCIQKKYSLHKDKTFTIKSFYSIPISEVEGRYGINFLTVNHTEVNVPKILKLHGSINWLYAGISQSDPVFCNSDFARKSLPYLSKDLQPMIVPPVMDKTSIYNHTILKAIWRQAFDELRLAEEIYICGFSFPETDLSIRFLFQSALEKNKNLQKIYFINTEMDLENKKKHFSNALIGYENKLDFTYCCEDSLNKFIQNVIP